MELSLISGLPEAHGRRLRPYRLEEIDTVGVLPHEPFSIRFQNTSSGKVQIAISVDGTNVLTGKKAELDPKDTFVVQPHTSATLDAWPESREGGARFIFGETEDSVAVHTHGDTRAKGYVSVAVWVEGHQPPQFIPRGGFDLGDEVFRGGGLRGGGTFGDYDDMGATRGAPTSYGTKGITTRGGPAAGAGQYTQQRIGTARGLILPKYSELIQVRYLWWDELVPMLREHGVRPTPAHPTGFEPRQMANLGTTPRIGEPSVTDDVEYSRFVAA
jgi:hypothetical protein